MYSNSFAFCRLCCHHAACQVFIHRNIKRKKIICFPPFLSCPSICCWPGTAGQERDWRLESPVVPWSFLQILSCFFLLLAKAAENPACYAGQCLPTNKSHRSCWAFDIGGHSQLHWKVLHSTDQKVMERKFKSSTNHVLFTYDEGNFYLYFVVEFHILPEFTQIIYPFHCYHGRNWRKVLSWPPNHKREFPMVFCIMSQ